MSLDRAEAERRIGQTLAGKWTLERVLGLGGMAAAYEARHAIGRLDAIKILHPHLARHPALSERFLREARAVNLFKHPGVVEVLDVGSTGDGLPFLVMELVEGQPVEDYLRRGGSVDVEELLRLADELLDALAAAHAIGIVHRDIKPGNLLVASDGRLKVLDFGIARVRSVELGELTETGTVLGTAAYMPPEQIRGSEVDGRADLFAVGATLFRLLTGRRIHESSPSEGDLLVRMATERAPPLRRVVPDAPEGLGLVVDRALELDREDRYPDAPTMQADVRALRRGEPPPFAAARVRIVAAPEVSNTMPHYVPPAWAEATKPETPVARSVDRTLSASGPLAAPSANPDWRRPQVGSPAPGTLLAAGAVLLFPALLLNLGMLWASVTEIGRDAGPLVLAISWLVTLIPLGVALMLLRMGLRSRRAMRRAARELVLEAGGRS